MTVVVPPAVVWYAFQQSDAFARTVVILLVLVSIYAWTLIVDKFRTVGRAAHANRGFRRQFERRQRLVDLATAREHGGPLAAVYQAAMEEIMAVLGLNEGTFEAYCQKRSLPRGLTHMETERIRETMDRTVAGQVFGLQGNLNALGTVVSVSPFLGLLGTVWGVMAAFTAMARAGRPDISAMAPGISGALLTTVVGLLVAIPCVVAYNAIAGRVKAMTNEMDWLVDQVVDDLRREMS